MGGTWRMPLDEAAWGALPEEIHAPHLPRAMRVIDSPAVAESLEEEPAWSVEGLGDRLAFDMLGRAATFREMHWSRPLESVDLRRHAYYFLRYRMRGVQRRDPPLGLLTVEGQDDAGEGATATLLDSAAARSDGLWHTVIGQLKAPFTAEVATVRLVTIDSSARLEVAELSLHEGLPDAPAYLTPELPAADAPGVTFERIELDEQFNDTYAAAVERLLARQGHVVDGGGLPDDGDASGIPFRASGTKAGLIRPPEDGSVNGQPAEFAGISTVRAYLEPEGRDDGVAVSVGRSVGEVFLLIVAEMPSSFKPYALSPQPFELSDVGAVAAELVYADGESEFAFPYSLADGGFRVQRTCGAYALAADPSRILAQVVLHNRISGSTFSVAAATVNTGSERVLPALAQEPENLRVPELPPPPERPPSVRRRGDTVTLSNRYYRVVLNLRDGLSIDRINSRWSNTPLALDGRSGLEVISGDTLLTGRAFSTRSVTVDENTVTAVLASAHPEFPLELTATFQVEDSPHLRTHLSLRNVGEAPRRWTVRFPVLRGLSIGEPEDTWLFFPQYRAVVSNELGLYIAPYDLHFSTQVTDVYNPRAGLGLAVLTRNHANAALDYSLAKDAEGVSSFVQYPGEFHVLAPGEAKSLVDTSLLFHRGDWHEAVKAYSEWLATWYEPVDSQDKPWFRETFVLRPHNTRKFWDWVFPIYDPETQEYRVDDFVEGDTAYLGLKPQLFHLFGWTDLEGGWKGHPNGDFDPAGYTGAPGALQRAVTRLQDHHGIPTSLYTLSDRCHKESEVGKTLGPRIARRRADGSPVQDDANWFVCPCSTQWHEHYAQALARTQAETGVKVLYVDVFGYPRSSTCYATDHGHPVPSDANEGCLALLKRIREALPPEVAIWSEYPVNDVAYQYLDGHIQYYCLYWHTHFSKLHDRADTAAAAAPVPLNLERYVFPGVKQLVFPCGVINWSSDSKFPFFNGEGLYEASWCTYVSPHLDRVRKSLALRSRYADCFTSMQPDAWVPTERRHVHANRFPGQGRTVWTLYNARYTTVDGPVLTVAHHTGARYYDAWNDRQLEPTITAGRATISLKLGPQELGCIVQE